MDTKSGADRNGNLGGFWRRLGAHLAIVIGSFEMPGSSLLTRMAQEPDSTFYFGTQSYGIGIDGSELLS